MSEMPTKQTSGMLVCVNKAIKHELPNTEQKEISGKFDFSLEMCRFLPELASGKFAESNYSHQKCLDAISRRGCYQDPILNEFYTFTESGVLALEDAKLIWNKMVRYYQDTEKRWIESTEGKTMDEIVPYGRIPSKALFILRHLYNITVPENSSITLPTSTIEYTHLEAIQSETGRQIVLMSSVRNNWRLRDAVNYLIKFGLVDIITFARSAHSMGKGRPPVGFAISPQGTRFFDDYLSTYDQARIAKNRRNQQMEDHQRVWGQENAHEVQQDKTDDEDIPPLTLPPTPTPTPIPYDLDKPSDLVDGEDLRKLFG